MENPLQPGPTNEYLAPMERYKEAVLRLFPALPRELIDDWFINSTNALVLGYFLEHYPLRVVALDVGTFIGASAFCFASHPKVSKVVSVDPNPTLSGELAGNSERWSEEVDFESLKDLKVLGVARAVLAEFGEEREKICLREGVVGGTQVNAEGGTIPELQNVDVPVADPAEGLVALVDGLHTREGVRADLAAIFATSPRAVALLDDCRNRWGPFVQAGVVDFMEGMTEAYHFRVFGDLGPGLAKSSFGIVYPESVAAEIDEVLGKVRTVFRERHDPERLLRRKLEEARKGAAHFESRAYSLQEQLSKTREENARIKNRVSNLEKHRDQIREQKDQLDAHYSSRRYKLVDAVAGAASRIAGLRHLPRRKTG